ncbi:MAG: DUF87 domain-containing protein [Lachnospiraceae bacterium]|nr:DUF87 domain-containing protein [Lachnospiraceae bacterium]MDY3223821.1 DUF87 domain-containing protein [Lachnospiraceae bacterium]
MSKNKRWKRLHYRLVQRYFGLLILCGMFLFSIGAWGLFTGNKTVIVWGLIAFFLMTLSLASICFRILQVWKIAGLMERFVKSNGLYQTHHVAGKGLLKDAGDHIDYYPAIYYRKIPEKNYFEIRIRMDGSCISERFRELEQPMANLFRTVCTQRKEERGYLTYCFELREQNQERIETEADILPAKTGEIAFTQDISWNWKKCPHFLLTGNTGSGKTQLAQYIITCLSKQSARVLYCDPKNDREMRHFAENIGIVYASEEREIGKVVRETEEEMRKRGQELECIGKVDVEFCPVYLIFDELIAFSKIAERKTYEETAKRIASIVVMGRSKCVYAGLILQRPDTAFVEGAIRDNLSCRICMGQMSETAYTMAFGADFSKVKNYRQEIGSGLIYRQGIDTKPREFFAPFIHKGALGKV